MLCIYRRGSHESMVIEPDEDLDILKQKLECILIQQ